eukprot:6861280-Ditylum_brightwellii.AAC.1
MLPGKELDFGGKLLASADLGARVVVQRTSGSGAGFRVDMMVGFMSVRRSGSGAGLERLDDPVFLFEFSL